MKLSAAAIGTLPPRKQPYRDHLVPGLAIDIGPRRRRWCLAYRDGQGKQKTETLGFFVSGAADSLGLADARQKARAVLQRIDAGLPVVVAQPVQHPKDKEVVTIGDMIDKYETAKRTPTKLKAGQLNKKPRGLKSLHKTLVAVRSGLADYIDTPAKDFTKFDMRAAIAKIAGRGALQMSDRTLTYANAIFAWAAKNDIIDHNPCAAVDKVGPGTTIRERVLEDDELRAIWNATFKMTGSEGRRNYGALVRFLMIVPLRLNEARLAVYGEFLDGRIRLKEERNKGNREFRLSLPDMALDIVGNGTAMERVFPNTQSLWRLKNELDELCGVKHWRTHDLRRTISTRLQDMGEPPHLIGALLNHKTGDGATAHYLHGDGAKQKAEALKRWEGELRKVLKIRATA